MIRKYAQSEYRFKLYDNVHKKTWQQIQKDTGCYGIVNLCYFDMKTFAHADTIAIDGRWLVTKAKKGVGVCITKDGVLTIAGETTYPYEFGNGEPCYILGGKNQNQAPVGRNGSTMIGTTPAGDVVIALHSKDQGITSNQGISELKAAGCTSIARFDGSWSSQGRLSPSEIVQPSQKRIVRSYLLIFQKKESVKDDMSGKKIVCLDPGHGTTCPNGSPDGTYKEHEFAWGMCEKIAAELERCGVQVVKTRTKTSYPSLSERAATANKAKADLFISIHSNAAGGGDWSSAHGVEVYTYKAGSTAARNKAAECVIKRMKAAGIDLRNPTLRHANYAVLRETSGPAMLIEYGFHTSRADVELLKSESHRMKLAEATARGVCDFLGVPYKAAPPVQEPTAKPEPEVDYAAQVQKRFGFADSTMDYLKAYKFADDLLKRLAEGE